MQAFTLQPISDECIVLIKKNMWRKQNTGHENSNNNDLITIVLTIKIFRLISHKEISKKKNCSLP